MKDVSGKRRSGRDSTCGSSGEALWPLPDLCAGSRGGEEMEQDGGLMNVHSCLPRLILSVQTGRREREWASERAGVHTLPSVGKRLRCLCVSVSVHVIQKNLCDVTFQSASSAASVHRAQRSAQGHCWHGQHQSDVCFFTLSGCQTQLARFTSFELGFLFSFIYYFYYFFILNSASYRNLVFIFVPI